jgi:purine nucleoside phosphorylase
MKARIGIIGGTGVYDPKMFELKEIVRPHTPYGPPRTRSRSESSKAFRWRSCPGTAAGTSSRRT